MTLNLLLLLQDLQDDAYRIPVKTRNILMMSDASRSSYVALDTLAHIHKYGMCTILSLKVSDSNYDKLSGHVPSDLTRRIQYQFKKPNYSFEVKTIDTNLSGSSEEVIQKVKHELHDMNCDTIIIGYDYNNTSESGTLSVLINWCLWQTVLKVILVKSSTRILPFKHISMARKFLICVKDEQSLESFFLESLELMRPSDCACLISIPPVRDPVGDYKESRFDFGPRYPWISGPDIPVRPGDKPGWNDEIVNSMKEKMTKLIERSQINGYIKVNYSIEFRTIGQQLCQAVIDESIDCLVCKRGSDREVSEECVQEALCTVILL